MCDNVTAISYVSITKTVEKFGKPDIRSLCY